MSESIRIEIDVQAGETLETVVEHLQRGDDVILTRGGRVLGRMTLEDDPDGKPDAATVARRLAALKDMEAYRRTLTNPLSVDEILEIVKEGRRG
ncbi:hypothetical protein [Mongoliimonas terrestris]|uniref:hypothetical protein n=1 Tax=Mongoliimonas terrestris TaxID=1709001 RepID=UPI0009495AB2|nr:hypothetical protein [Mongoliimonas terrestris]